MLYVNFQRIFNRQSTHFWLWIKFQSYHFVCARLCVCMCLCLCLYLHLYWLRVKRMVVQWTFHYIRKSDEEKCTRLYISMNSNNKMSWNNEINRYVVNTEQFLSIEKFNVKINTSERDSALKTLRLQWLARVRMWVGAAQVIVALLLTNSIHFSIKMKKNWKR